MRTKETMSKGALVRQQVRALLSASTSYGALPADARRQIAKDTVRVGAYLVDPHGLMTLEFRGPLLAGVVSRSAGRRSGAVKLPPDSIRMSPRAMDEMVAAVDFPAFVAGLINGVFGAIVNASIRQMEAYAALVASVSKSLDEFMRDNVSDSSARDSLVDEFPDVFCWTGSTVRRLKLHAKAGSPGLARLAAGIGLRKPVTAPQESSEVKRIVAAARRRLARNRQQLLATMILMGINRIAATDGRM